MTREEMLKKLKSIKPTIAGLIMTYDMGLEFTVMDSTGMVTNIGNYGDWPLWKFNRLSNEVLGKIGQSIKNNSLTTEELPEPLKNFAQNIINQYKDINLSEVFKRLLDFPVSEEKKFFYILCDTDSWTLEINFFETEEEIKNYFFNNFEILYNWDDLDNDDLQECCSIIDEDGEGIPIKDTTEPEE